jgi:hypothetical protein
MFPLGKTSVIHPECPDPKNSDGSGASEDFLVESIRRLGRIEKVGWFVSIANLSRALVWITLESLSSILINELFQEPMLV